MPVRTVASQSKSNFFVCMRRVVLFTAFLCTSFTRLPVLGRSFLDSNRSDNPCKHIVHDKIDKVIETGKGQKVKVK